MRGIRAALVLVHRWAGLAIAAFLVLSGLSGSVLAWNKELDAWIYPALAAPPTERVLDPLLIRERLQAQFPQVEFTSVDLHTPPGRAMVFNPRIASAKADFDQVFVNPATGAVQGTRMWGDPSQGLKNLMPFIHRLHYSLAAGGLGTTLLGVVALIWTLNCVVGLLLTFPLPQRNARQPRPWLQRWRGAWQVRWHSGFAKLSFDLHSATALWCWLILLAMAWSAVSLALPQVFNPIMQAALPHQQVDVTPSPARNEPCLTWPQAREAGRSRMREQAALHGFSVKYETSLQYDAGRDAFRYAVRSDRDVRSQGGDTYLWIDACTGRLLMLWLPTAEASGDTVTTWLKALHMASLWGGPWKAGLTLTGMVVVLTSITGVLLWARKRRGRLFSMPAPH